MENNFSIKRSVRYQYEFYILGIFITILIGCSATRASTQKECFIKENPIEAKKYTKLNIISFGSWESSRLEEYSYVTTLLGAVKQEFSEDKDVEDFVDILKERYLKSFDERTEWIKGLSKNDIIEGDEIYLFEYVTEQILEYGVLVLNDCKIRKRFVDVHSEKSEAGK